MPPRSRRRRSLDLAGIRARRGDVVHQPTGRRRDNGDRLGQPVRVADLDTGEQGPQPEGLNVIGELDEQVSHLLPTALALGLRRGERALLNRSPKRAPRSST